MRRDRDRELEVARVQYLGKVAEGHRADPLEGDR